MIAQKGQALHVTGHSHASWRAILESVRLLNISKTGLVVRPDVTQVAGRVGLILPTSLCSGQVAVRIAQRLNDRVHRLEDNVSDAWQLTKFVALPHTEGCGHSSGDHEALVLRTLLVRHQLAMAI